MKCNVGGLDRTVRVVIGVVLLVVGLGAPVEMAWRIVALAVSAIALVTAIAGFCPVNWFFGVNTCEGARKK